MTRQRIRHTRRWLIAGAFLGIAGVATLVVLWMRAPRPVPRVLRLQDGVEAFFMSDTRIDPAPAYPQPRQLHVDGDAFIRVPAASTPLIVRTRLLVLTVTGTS